MTTELKGHLGPEDWGRLLAGQEIGAARDAHIDRCPLCRDLLAEFEDLREGLEEAELDESQRTRMLEQHVRRLCESRVPPEVAAPAAAPAKPAATSPPGDESILVALAFPAPLEDVARRLGLGVTDLDRSISALDAELADAGSDFLAAAEQAVAHVKRPDEWPVAPPVRAAAAERLALAAGGAKPLPRFKEQQEPPLRAFPVMPTGITGPEKDSLGDVYLSVEEELRDGALRTIFRLNGTGVEYIQRVSWRLYFLPEHEEGHITTAHPGISRRHLGALRARYGEDAWSDLIDRLVPHRKNEISPERDAERVVLGRLPGWPRMTSLMIET